MPDNYNSPETIRDLEERVRNQRDKNEYTIRGGMLRGYTPNQVLDEVRNGSRLGKELLRKYNDRYKR